MKLCDLFGLVATAASGSPLDRMGEIESYKMAQLAKDVHFEQHGKDLVFRNVTGQKAEVTEEVLGADSRISAFVLFSFSQVDKRWSALETFALEEMWDLLDSKEDEASYRYVILGAHLITDKVRDYTANLGHYRGALLIELTPTC